MTRSEGIKQLFIRKLAPSKQKAVFELADFLREAVYKAGPVVGIHALEYVKAQMDEIVAKEIELRESK